MQFRLPSTLFVALAIVAASSTYSLVEARRPSGGRAPPSRRGPSTDRSRGSSRGGSRKPVEASRRGRPSDDYEEEDEFDFGGLPGDSDGYDEEDANEYDAEEDDMYDDYEEVKRSSRSRPSHGGRHNVDVDDRDSARSSSRRGPSRPSRGGRPGDRPGPGDRSGSNRDRGGRVVSYGNSRRGAPQPSAFTRGLSALRESIPDPSAIKNTAFNSMSAVRESTSKLSSNLYREMKGLTSSELEQVMLKATQPNDTPVKGKHVERLVGVTYQISGRYDIYDAVLRKVWGKMVEKDWRTNIKALYILHRFSADGAPDHQAALKARLRELRRTRDPKRKEKYFNSKQLLAGDSTPANKPFRSFLGRYAHYVLLRAQCFGGIFAEIAVDPSTIKSKSKKTQPKKVITSTCLKNEHLEAAQLLLKAGLACALKDDEECENTAIALERVVSDLIGLTTAVAKALNNALKSNDFDGEDMDRDLVKKWCEFYSEELLPKTKAMVKSTAPTLDAYGLFLPSRMGANVSQDLLQQGLKGAGGAAISEKRADVIDSQENEDVSTESEEKEVEQEVPVEEEHEEEEVDGDEKENMYDEYEYDEYEYDEY